MTIDTEVELAVWRAHAEIAHKAFLVACFESEVLPDSEQVAAAAAEQADAFVACLRKRAAE